MDEADSASSALVLSLVWASIAQRQSYDLLSLAWPFLFSPALGLLQLADSSHNSLVSALNGAAT
jgi:hypothetical protein